MFPRPTSPPARTAYQPRPPMICWTGRRCGRRRTRSRRPCRARRRPGCCPFARPSPAWSSCAAPRHTVCRSPSPGWPILVRATGSRAGSLQEPGPGGDLGFHLLTSGSPPLPHLWLLSSQRSQPAGTSGVHSPCL